MKNIFVVLTGACLFLATSCADKGLSNTGSITKESDKKEYFFKPLMYTQMQKYKIDSNTMKRFDVYNNVDWVLMADTNPFSATEVNGKLILAHDLIKIDIRYPYKKVGKIIAFWNNDMMYPLVQFHDGKDGNTAPVLRYHWESGIGKYKLVPNSGKYGDPILFDEDSYRPTTQDVFLMFDYSGLWETKKGGFTVSGLK